ncbi:kelch-like protein diablo isoform X3 [Bolinopsis microptera]|uniref:kelch-like protein diablo isoform X1 n=1 Tax=Bolinopsis microptera TaxID=2820187 RepID=UPI00307A9A32
MEMNSVGSAQPTLRTLVSYSGSTTSVTEIKHDMYAEHLLNNLHGDRSMETCDVIIKTKENTSIFAHSAILRPTNIYFRKNLDFRLCKAGRYTIDLSHLSATALQDIIDYLYTGQFNIVNKKFLSMVLTLKELEMEEIIDQCMEKLKTSLSDKNVFDILEQSTGDIGVLNSVAMTYIEDNFKTLYKNDRILRLNWESFHKILSSDRLNVENEDKVYQLALAWVAKDDIGRKPHVTEICSKIRIPFMTDYGLQNMVCNKNILTSNEEFYNNIETLLGNPAALQVPFYQRVNDKMGKIFVFGGYLNRSHITTTMEVYNRRTGAWETIEEMNMTSTPPSIYSATMTSVAVDNKIYIAGGQSDSGTRLDTTFVFDGILSIWASLQEMPTVRVKSAAARFGNFLYVSGGQKDRHTMNEVIRLNIHRDLWETVNPMIHARHSHGMVTAGQKIFAVGGDSGTGPVATAEVFDKGTGQWSEIASMSNARFGCQLVAIKSQVYVTGGWNGRRALHECEKYNEENDSWGYISPMATRRYGHMAVSFGSKIYVLGGQQSGPWTAITGAGARKMSTHQGPGMGKPLNVQHEDAIASVEYYDAVENVWTRAPDMGNARAWAAVGAVM